MQAVERFALPMSPSANCRINTLITEILIMENTKKYKLRCRKLGVLVCSELTKYDIVWKREFNPIIYSIDN